MPDTANSPYPLTCQPEELSLLQRGLILVGFTAAYFVTGKISLLLAVPPGYATAIWPPSGIALAGILLFGYWTWPSILLGSFLVNISTTFDASNSTATLLSIALPLIIAGGAALQGCIGAFLVRRFGNYPNLLSTEKEVLSFLFYGGFVGCFVNSSLATTALLLTGRMPVSNFFNNWGTWWAGDAIGVLIFTPLALAWGARPAKLWRDRRLVLTVPITITFALAVFSVTYTTKLEGDRIAFKFDQSSVTLASDLGKVLDEYSSLLESLESFYAASSQIDRNQFRIFTRQYLQQYPNLQALSWNPRVSSADRTKFEAAVQKEGFADFQITERGSGGRLIRAGDRPEYVVVHYIEPVQNNKAALGFDVYSEAVRREALDKARDTGQPVVSSRIKLVQEKGQQAGVLIFLPIYRNGLPPHTVEERRLNLAGYVVGVLRMGDVVEGILKKSDLEGIDLRLVDRTAEDSEKILYGNEFDAVGSNSTKSNRSGLFSEAAYLKKDITIPFGQRQWVLTTEAGQDYFAKTSTKYAWLFLFTGLLLTGLIGAFALIVSGRGRILRQMVEEQTAALKKSEGDFRRAQTLLISAIDTIEEAFVIYDDEDRLYLCNEQYRATYAISAPAIQVGNTFEAILRYGLDHRQYRDAIGREEEWLEERLDHHRKADTDIIQPLADGRWLHILERRTPEGYVVGFRADVTALMHSKEQAEAANDKLAKSNSELEHFAYAASHDLRQPLRMISSYVGLLNKRLAGRLDDDEKQFIGFAVDGAQRMDHMINDLLNYSRIGRDMPDPTQVSLEQPLQFAVHNLEMAINEAKAEILCPAVMPSVWGHATQLERLFQNLIGNALKFIPPDRTPKVVIECRETAWEWVIAISDNGIGIAPENMDRLFKIFQRLVSHEQYHGTGIGLASCRKIVEQHGGKIWAESQEGVGSTFLFSLPKVGKKNVL